MKRTLVALTCVAAILAVGVALAANPTSKHADKSVDAQKAEKAAAQMTATDAGTLPTGAVHLGEALEGKDRVTLATVRANPEKYFEQTLFVEATAVDVCQSKGCWMTVTDGDAEPIWVAWGTGCGGKYSFPKDVSGKRVLIQGSFCEKEISEKDAKHLAEESKGMDAEKIAGRTFEMNATAVVVLPVETKAPGA